MTASRFRRKPAQISTMMTGVPVGRRPVLCWARAHRAPAAALPPEVTYDNENARSSATPQFALIGRGVGGGRLGDRHAPRRADLCARPAGQPPPWDGGGADPRVAGRRRLAGDLSRDGDCHLAGVAHAAWTRLSVPLVVFGAALLQSLTFWLTTSLHMTAVIDATGVVLAYTVAWVYGRYCPAAVWWLLPWLAWMPMTLLIKLWAISASG